MICRVNYSNDPFSCMQFDCLDLTDNIKVGMISLSHAILKNYGR